MEKIKIIYSLPSERWEEYRDLKILSLTEDPKAFGRSKNEFLPERTKSVDRWVADLTELNSKILFVENEIGTLIGMIKVNIYLNLAGKAKLECHLNHFFVAKEYQGQGIGRALFDKAMLLCNEWKAGKITLNVVWSQRIAHSMYSKSGFKTVSYGVNIKKILLWRNMALTLNLEKTLQI